MTTRRGFLGAILAAGVAPAFAGSGVLMPVKKLWVPPVLGMDWAIDDEMQSSMILWGDGIHDDTRAMQAFLDGKPVVRADNGQRLSRYLTGGTYMVTNTLRLTKESDVQLANLSLRGVISGDWPLMHLSEGSRLDMRGCTIDTRPPRQDWGLR